MKTRLFCLGICFVFAISALAQDTNDPGSFSKKDFGFNTSFIFQGFFQSSSAPFSILYKKYKEENKALRLGIRGSFHLNDEEVDRISNNTNFVDNTFVEFDFTIGRETQHELGGKWMWYHGADLMPGFSLNTSATFNSGIQTNSATTTTYRLVARPFIGLRFNINKRLYISTEASADLAYSFAKNKQKSFNPEQTVRDASTGNFLFNINPASGVFVFYRF